MNVETDKEFCIDHLKKWVDFHFPEKERAKVLGVMLPYAEANYRSILKSNVSWWSIAQNLGAFEARNRIRRGHVR